MSVFPVFFTELSVKNCLTLYSSDAITEVTLSSTNPIKLLTRFQQGPALRFHVGYDTKRKKGISFTFIYAQEMRC